MSLEVGKWGRYWGPHPTTGERTSFVRATTIAKVGDDPNGLINWKAGKALQGAARRPDLLALVASHEDKVPAKVVDQCAEAAESGAGANYGTALHQTLEQIDLGGTPVVLDAVAGQVAAYRQALTNAGLTIEGCEFKVANTGLGVDVCGTVDRTVIGRNGARYVFDIKTSKPTSVPYSGMSWAAQLAIYAYSDHQWDDFADEWRPFEVNRRFGIIAHVPLEPMRKVGGKWQPCDPYCDLLLVDLEAGWEEAQRMAALYRARKRVFIVGEAA